MKKQIILLFCALIALSSFAQELKENQHHGEIVFANGKTFKGIIEANMENPWELQKEVKYYSEDLLSKPKIKNKEKLSVKAKQATKMTVDNKEYNVVKYADLTAMGSASIPRLYFLETVADGKIKLYKYYHTPMFAGNSDEVKQSWEDSREKPDYVIWKEGEKLKAIQNVDLREYFNDCPTVNEAYMNGTYGNKAVSEEKSNFMSKVHSEESIRLLNEAIVLIVEEYNKTMK